MKPEIVVTARLARCLFLLAVLLAAIPVQAASRFAKYEFNDHYYDSLNKAEAAMRDASGVYGPYMKQIGDAPRWRDDFGEWEYRYNAPRVPAELGTPTWYNAGIGCEFAECLTENAAIQKYFDSRQGSACFRNIQAPEPWGDSALVSGTLYPSLHVGWKKRYTYEETYKKSDGSCATYWVDRVHDVTKNTPISCPEGFEIDSVNDWYECAPEGSRIQSIYVEPLPDCCLPTHGNPIDLLHGSKRHTETLYSANWITYTLGYGSRSNFNGTAGWQDNFSMRVMPNYNGYVYGIVRPNGTFLEVRYYYYDNRYVIQGKSGLDLYKESGNWKIRNANDEVEVYSNAGQLLRIERPGRSDLTLIRDERGRVIRIEDERGHTLTLVRNELGLVEKVVGPAGEETVLTYGLRRRLEAIRYPDGAIKRFLYDDPINPTSFTGIIDANGDLIATYAYDDNGRAIRSSHFGGSREIEVVYNADGSASVHEATGNIVNYTFSDVGDTWLPIAASAPCADDCTFPYAEASYNGHRRLTRTVDFNGVVTLYSYDSKGRLTQRVEAAGTPHERTITYTQHPVFQVPTRITEPGRTTDYTYDANGNRLAETITDTATGKTRTTTWTYNVFGQVLTIDGPRTNVSDVTTYSYDAYGNLATITNALGHVTRYTRYDAHGNPLEIVDPNGIVTKLGYDPRHRLVSRTVAFGTGSAATTVFDYDPVGQLVKTTFPDGSWVEYEYDAAHRMTAIEDSAGNRIDYVLDAMGSRIEETVTGPGGAVFRKTFRDYNALNRLVAVYGPEGSTVSHGYDGEGNRITVTDAASNNTTSRYDTLGRLFETVDALSGITSYDYDTRDNLTQVIDPRGVITTYAYNGFNELTKTGSPDSGITTYTYDKGGNRISRTDARGVTVTFGYDTLNRLTFIDYPGTDQDITYTYDGGASGCANCIGRLTRVDDETGYTTYRYDARGNLVNKLNVIETAGGQRFLPVGYSHDEADRLTSISYPGGDFVQYQRDANGRIIAVTLTKLGGSQIDLLTGIQYAPFGPVEGLTFGNGIAEIRIFDKEGRLSRVQSNVLDHGYTWSATGTITGITDNLDATRSQSFDYDALYRLTGASGAYGDLEWTYDAVGNRLTQSETPVGGTLQSTTYTYASASNRLTAVIDGSGVTNYQYDAIGNTTDSGEHTFSYGARNRLVSADGTNSYDHNALGQRVIKITSSGTILFVYDEVGHLLGEYDDLGNPIRQYVWLGDRPVAMLEPSGVSTDVYYIHSDHLNTPQAITDGNQSVVWRANYEPYGKADIVVENIEFNLRFAGQYQDEETGLHQNYFRSYDPGTGRYNRPDPIGFAGGNNNYRYANASPVMFTDRLGLYPDCERFQTGLEKRTWERYEDDVLLRQVLPVPIPTGGSPTAEPSLRPPTRPPVRPGVDVELWLVEYMLVNRKTYQVEQAIQTWKYFCKETRTDECGNETTYRTSGEYKKKLDPYERLIDERVLWTYEMLKKLGNMTL